MEKILKGIKPKYFWLLAFLLTALTYTMAFSVMGMLNNGIYIIARSDLNQQYIPFIEYFCEVLKGKHDYWFSWSLNMGSGTSLLFAYYVLSPFNIFFLILGEERVLTATALVIVLKAATSAAVFQIFIYKLQRHIGYASVLFAMMYALCGFQVSYYFNIIWMDALYILPLLCIGFLKLVKERKVTLLLITYTYIFGVNFYIGYIVGVSSFILCIIYYVYKRKRIEKSNRKKIIIKYFSCVLAAFLLTAFIWLPAVLQLSSNLNNNYSGFSIPTCNPLFLYNNLFMGQMQTLHGITPFIYCGLMSMILLPLYFLNRRIRKKERFAMFLCLLIFGMLFLIKPFNLAMHAFDYPEMFNHRFGFVYSFIITIIGSRQVLFIKKEKSKKLFCLIFAYILLYISCMILYPVIWHTNYNANNLFNGAVNAVFIILWIILLIKIKSGKWDSITIKTVATFLLMVELVVNAAMSIDRMEHKLIRQDEFEIWRELGKSTIECIKNSETDNFYRVLHLNNFNANIAFQNDFNSLTSFNSSEHTGLWNALEKLGFYHGLHLINGGGSTPVTQSVFGIKYLVSGISIEGDLEGNVYQSYEKNDKALSLGFMVDEAVLDYQFGDSPFQNQNELLTALTGKNIQCFERTDMKMHVKDGIYAREDDCTYLLNEENSNKLARFNFTKAFDGRPLYAYFSQDRYVDRTGGAEVPEIETNDITSMYENTIFKPSLVPARIFRVGTNESGEYELTIQLTEGLTGDYYQKAYFYYYMDEEFLKAYNLLKENELVIETYDDGYIKGSIDVGEKNLLFTSIPYDDAWQVWVDDKKTESLALVENAFLGIELEEGYHEIIMKYDPLGRKEGKWISLVTFIAVISGYLLRRRVFRQQ